MLLGSFIYYIIVVGKLGNHYCIYYIFNVIVLRWEKEEDLQEFLARKV
jgi:hypothetical protein